MFGIKGQLPSQSRRYRRSWALEFARRNFSGKDFFKVTDASFCDGYQEPIGSFDRSLSSEALEPYFEVLGASNFTLCPGGDEPWSMRAYEAAGAGSLPVILSRDSDWSARMRGDIFGA